MTNSEINAHKKHPAGLWYVSISTALYCLAFGSINSLLVLYAEKLGLSHHLVYELFAAYNSLLFTLPLLGGYLSGKLGYKNGYAVGLLFCLIGCIALSIETNMSFYIGLASFAVGVGFAAPSSYCLVGMLYAKQDGRRESGYTLFYMIFNVGFALAAVIGGYASTDLGYPIAFTINAVSIALAALTFFIFLPYIKAYQGRSMESQVAFKLPKIFGILLLTAVILTPLCILLLFKPELDGILLWGLVIISSIGVLLLAFRQRTTIAKYKLFAFLLLSFISISFWALYMLEPSLLTIFIKSNVDRNIFGHVIPPSVFYGLDPVFIIIFGIVFSWLWRFLSKRGKNLSLPTKFSFALLSMGLGFLIFAWSTHHVDTNKLINPTWIIGGYMLLTIAELLISPIGISMVGRLSPEKYEGLLMGIWQLFTGFSAVISGYISGMTVLPNASKNPTISNPVYAKTFIEVGLITIAVGIVAFLLVPAIKKLVNTPSEPVRVSEL